MGSAIERLYTIQSRPFGKNMKKPKFKTHEAWFKAQFGKLPSSHDAIAKLHIDIADTKIKLNGLRLKLNEIETYETIFAVSRFVWNIAQAGDIPKLKIKRK